MVPYLILVRQTANPKRQGYRTLPELFRTAFDIHIPKTFHWRETRASRRQTPHSRCDTRKRKQLRTRNGKRPLLSRIRCERRTHHRPHHRPRNTRRRAVHRGCRWFLKLRCFRQCKRMGWSAPLQRKSKKSIRQLLCASRYTFCRYLQRLSAVYGARSYQP